MEQRTPDRRELFSTLSRPAAQSTAAPARLAPVQELITLTEFETMARLRLEGPVHASIAGSDRRSFDRMTFRQRLMVNGLGLDLTTELFGEKHYAPIMIGPMAEQRAYHPDGELETARGAAAGKVGMVVSSTSSVPIDRIAAEATTPLWSQVSPADGADTARQAEAAGCTAICLTVGVESPGAGDMPRAAVDPRHGWDSLETFVRAVGVPIIVKGVMTPAEATEAIERGARGIVVSNYGGVTTARPESPMEALPGITNGVNGRVPVLIDGSFRRGTDVLKALALGASAVLIGRPAMWGLAAYGAAGIEAVVWLLINELARSMAASGRPTIADVDERLVRIHAR